MADDVKKFKEIFDNCIDESMKRVDMKKLSEQKRQGMIQKFKKAMGV
jgi:adenylylsulfate kinase-like enzyme